MDRISYGHALYRLRNYLVTHSFYLADLQSTTKMVPLEEVTISVQCAGLQIPSEVYACGKLVTLEWRLMFVVQQSLLFKHTI